MRYRLALFLGAFLLFALQPLIGRAILPVYGGGAGVWLAVMLFSQLVLLVGYGLAHGLMVRQSPLGAFRIHRALLGLALAELLWPILAHGTPWLPVKGMPGTALAYPPLAIVAVLTLLAGVPMILLSATAPLVQSLYARAEGGEPYRLYAISNWGSLAGLLIYPLLIEPLVGLTVQAYLFAALFLGHAALMVWIFLGAGRSEALRQAEPPPAGERPGVQTWLRWLGLSALGTVWLMAVSNRISTDIASVPLIWVLPLGVYLLTFILAFEARWPLTGRGWTLAMGLILFAYAVTQGAGIILPGLGAMLQRVHPSGLSLALRTYSALQPGPAAGAGLALLALFAGGILAHGRLVDLKPEPRQLTWFYFFLSLGGCLGGLAVSLVAPVVFNQNYELPLALLITGWMLLRGGQLRVLGKRALAPMIFASLVVALGLVRLAAMGLGRQEWFARDFFGTVEIQQPLPSLRTMVHGRTVHGLQYVKEPLRPASYYGEESAIGRVLRALQRERPALRIGALGLGVGNVAAYGRPADHFTFYEISPKIIQLSGLQGTQFTVLRSSPSAIQVIPGDGRLSLENRQGKGFDVLLIDAFAGGHVPPHLLTREALQAYERTLAPGGVLVLHVSHHLPLPEQVGATLAGSGFFGLHLTWNGVVGQSRTGQKYMVESYSQYWIASRSPGPVFRPEYLEAARVAVVPPGREAEVPPELARLIQEGRRFTAGFRPWTDERNSLTPLLLRAGG